MQTLENTVKCQSSKVLDFNSFMSQDLVLTRHGPARGQPEFSQSLQIAVTDELGLGEDPMQAHRSSLLPCSWWGPNKAQTR